MQPSPPILPIWFIHFSQVEQHTPLPLVVVLHLLLGQKSLQHYSTILEVHKYWGVTLASRGNSAPKKLQGQEVLSLHNNLCSSTSRVLGDVNARTQHYAQLPTDAPSRTRFFFVHKWPVSEETHFVKSRLLHTLSRRKSTSKSRTYFMHLRSPAKSTFKCLILDTLLWCGVISTNLKNPKEQDDCKKGMLSNQPWLMRGTPTEFLAAGDDSQLKIWRP